MLDGLVLVSNIPPDYHTADLRRFFSDYVEQEKLICFHYRHRPEKKSSADDSPIQKTDHEKSRLPKSFSKVVTSRVHVAKDGGPPDRPTCCCLVHVDNNMAANVANQFISSFHRKHWLDSKDSELDTLCMIANVANSEQGALLGLPELRPPNIMPRGNVGTSTQFFLDAIRDCRLPAKLIGKLRLEFPKTKMRRYGSVPFEYEQTNGRTLKTQDKENLQRLNLKTIDREKLQRLNSAGPKIDQPKVDSDPEDDDDTCEEWERHEALHNDVQPNRAMGHQVQSKSYLAMDADLEQQAGTKDIPYEGEIEQVWEKGGSGLNWWTDSQYWKAQEGDFDEQTTDDWDVDMSVYYEKDAGHDKDAVDRFSMRQSEFLRSGNHSESLFKAPDAPRAPRVYTRRPGSRGSNKRRAGGARFAGFQAHTSGIGGRIMAAGGWKAGMGLGPSGSGIKVPIDGEKDAQAPRDHSGLGFSTKIVFATNLPSPAASAFVPPPPPGSRITTAYSGPEGRDPGERLERTNPPLYLKFRDQAIKFYSGGTTGGTYRPAGLKEKKAIAANQALAWETKEAKK